MVLSMGSIPKRSGGQARISTAPPAKFEARLRVQVWGIPKLCRLERAGWFGGGPDPGCHPTSLLTAYRGPLFTVFASPMATRNWRLWFSPVGTRNSRLFFGFSGTGTAPGPEWYHTVARALPSTFYSPVLAKPAPAGPRRALSRKALRRTPHILEQHRASVATRLGGRCSACNGRTR